MKQIPLSTWVTLVVLLVSITATAVTMQMQIGFLETQLREMKAELKLFENVHEQARNSHFVLITRVTILETTGVNIARRSGVNLNGN